jgi:hypothetical protein
MCWSWKSEDVPGCDAPQQDVVRILIELSLEEVAL